MLPDVRAYDRPTQGRAAAEIKGGACPALTGFAVDYKVMRDQTRAAKKILQN